MDEFLAWSMFLKRMDRKSHMTSFPQEASRLISVAKAPSLAVSAADDQAQLRYGNVTFERAPLWTGRSTSPNLGQGKNSIHLKGNQQAFQALHFHFCLKETPGCHHIAPGL
jgi:hypothetical protein